MGRSCAICISPDRAAIDRELSSGGTIAHIAAKREISPDSLKRHRTNHLLPVLRKALAEDPELSHLDPLEEIRTLYHRLNEQLDRAELEAENWQAVRAFYAEARKILELLAKLTGDLAQEGAVSVHLHPEYRKLEAIIVSTLEGYPDAFDAVHRAIQQANAAEGDALAGG